MGEPGPGDRPSGWEDRISIGPGQLGRERVFNMLAGLQKDIVKRSGVELGNSFELRRTPTVSCLLDLSPSRGRIDGNASSK